MDFKKFIVGIGFIGSLLTIIVFMTGKNNISEFSKTNNSITYDNNQLTVEEKKLTSETNEKQVNDLYHEIESDEDIPSFSNSTKKIETDYLHGVPPSPKYQEADIYITDETEGCFRRKEPIIGYIIEYEKIYGEEDYIYTYRILIQDINGVREDHYINSYDLCNATESWLPYILIPGNKVEVYNLICGNGGIKIIAEIKNLPRS